MGSKLGCKKAFLCHEVHREGLLTDSAPGGEGWCGGEDGPGAREGWGTQCCAGGL